MRIIAALLLILCLSWPGFAVQPKKKHSSTASTAAAKKKPAAKKGRRRGTTPRSLAQTAPTAERYQEIQQAMVVKGYGPQAPNGVWGPEWSSALKRYQQDQKLEPTGKLNSMSLITLGLGPKREPPAGVTAPPAQQPAAAPTLPAQPPAVAPAPPAAPADQPPSSSSTVREPK